MLRNKLKSVRIQAQKEIEGTKDLKELNLIFKKYLGKEGRVSLILCSLKESPGWERRKIGKEANEFGIRFI